MNSFAQTIEIYDLEEKSISKQKLEYILEAQKKTINLEKLKQLNLFNRKKVLKEYSFYTNGVFHQKNIKVNFSKGYFYNGKFMMENCSSFYKDNKIKSKYAVFDKKFIEFKKVSLTNNRTRKTKLRYKISILD